MKTYVVKLKDGSQLEFNADELNDYQDEIALYVNSQSSQEKVAIFNVKEIVGIYLKQKLSIPESAQTE